MADRPIPAFVNPDSGSGAAALEALEAAGAFAVEHCAPQSLPERIRRAIDAGAKRVVVAGGDGTIALAAATLAGTDTALAVLPGGTLNHFARGHGIPSDRNEATQAAVSGEVVTVDVGYVNDHIFLNTSSVGAYVSFVRTRAWIERSVGYRLASLIAAARLLGRIRPLTVELDLDRVARQYRSALVFVGVGERELRLPSMGSRAKNGRRGLHVIVVRGGTGARLISAGLIAAIGGNRAIASGRTADAFVVDRCRMVLRHPRGRVALDGELVEMESPLEYRIDRDVLKLVVPVGDSVGDSVGDGAGNGRAGA